MKYSENPVGLQSYDLSRFVCLIDDECRISNSNRDEFVPMNKSVDRIHLIENILIIFMKIDKKKT